MSRGWLSTVIVAALVSAAVTAALNWSGALARSSDVPQVEGLEATQARELLATRELLLVLDGPLADKARPGSLIRQRPLAGSQVPRNTAIHAFVAAALPESAPAPVAAAPTPVPAPAPVPVPVPVAAVPAPAPVAAVPAPVAAAPATSVAVARTPSDRTRSIPSLVGKRLPQAREAIQRAGYVVGDLRYGNDGDVGPDRVLRQSPPAGTPAPSGSRIDLVVNESE